MSRFRQWIFTLNNWTEDEVDTLLGNPHPSYVAFGKEVGANGTPHLQGVLNLKNAKTLSALKSCLGLPRIHLEVMKGSWKQAIDYCKKDGIFTEQGVRPVTPEEKGKKEKIRWKKTLSLCKKGRIDEIDSQLQITQCRNLEFVRLRELNKRPLVDAPRKCLWIHGKTGTGKTRESIRWFPNAYRKNAATKWWDGYEGQQYVIIDDVDKAHFYQGYYFKIWFDRYPFPAENKGTQRMIRPELIIVTSNWAPDEIWQDAQTLEPLLRRLEVISFDGDTLPLLEAYALPPREDVLTEDEEEEEVEEIFQAAQTLDTLHYPDTESNMSGSQAEEFNGYEPDGDSVDGDEDSFSI